MSKTKRKIVALGMALSLAFVLVAALLPMGEVEAAVVPGTPASQFNLYSNGSIVADSETAPTGATEIARLGGEVSPGSGEKAGTVSLDSVVVDMASKTVTFTNLVTTAMDIDQAAGWTYVFKGTNSVQARLMAEYGSGGTDPLTIKLDKGAKLTVTGFVAGENRPIVLEENTKANKDVSALADASGQVTDVIFTGPEDDSSPTDSGTVTPSDNSSASTDSTATTPTTTTTSAAASNTATTTKATAPKTADVMPFVPVVLVLAGATAIGVIAIRRKNS